MTNGSDPVPVALAVEQILLRHLLGHAIRQLGEPFELVACPANAAEARELCLRNPPRLLLLDLDQSRVDALEVARCLVRRTPQTRILALASTPDPVSLNRLDEIGVPGFVDKNQPLDVLEQAMREVSAGRRFRTELLISNQGRLRQDPQAFPKFLTGREQDILRLVAQGCTNRLIAERLGLSLRSVETFRYRLMRKLEVRNVASLIEFAFRRGWIKPDLS